MPNVSIDRLTIPRRYTNPSLETSNSCLKAGFQLREILRCRKFSLSFFSIVSDHAELMFKIQKKPCEIFRQRNISRNWKPTLTPT